MTTDHRPPILAAAAAACALAASCALEPSAPEGAVSEEDRPDAPDPSGESAEPQGEPDDDQNHRPEPGGGDDHAPAPAEVGELGPLIPLHKDAIHASLVWTGRNRETPKVCLWMRPAQYKGTHLVDPEGTSPDGGDTGGFIQAFEDIVRGGSEFSNRLDRSVQSRIKRDIPMDNGLCLDLTHPDAFKNLGKRKIATWDAMAEAWIPKLVAEDFDLNRDAFSGAGHSAGLNYNIFCAGNVQLPDGRLAFIGGHDKDGHYGLRKVNIFDPVTETWKPRPTSPVKEAYLAHAPDEHRGHPHPDAMDEANTDPSISSDMKYQRWYPSAATLPDGRVLILSGTDRHSGVEDPARRRTATPEIYNPRTDRTIALENARKVLPNYPLMHVVQTGPGADDWKVAVVGEVKNPPSPILAAQVEVEHPFTGKTWLFDVQAAEAAACHEPGENHWELIDTALSPHHRAGSASLWTLDGRGLPVSQKLAAFGGTNDVESVATVEMIDYQDRDPTWERQQDLIQPVEDNYAVVLPDGKALVFGGESPDGFVPKYNLAYQLFDPESGRMQTTVRSTVPRADHTTAVLLPDARVLVMGGDRTDLIPDDLIPGVPGNRDIGVPVGQVYRPPYLFKGHRPAIEHAPEEIDYGSTFDVDISRHCDHDVDKIDSIVLIRPSPQTHKWDWGNRRIELAFDKGEHGRLKVSAPATPALAVPGYYMLFALNRDGVPSKAKLVHFSVPE